jgi:hypothetical protein
MSIFDDSNSFRNVGIKNSNNELIVMNINTSSNNISFHSSTSDNNVDIMNIKTILNKNTNNELHLSTFDGSTINPVIQINNITQNVNISGNLNIIDNNHYNTLTLKGPSGASTLSSNIIFKRGNEVLTQIYNRKPSANLNRTTVYSKNNIEFILSESYSDFNSDNKRKMMIYRNSSPDVEIYDQLKVGTTIYPSDDRLTITNAIDTINKLQPEFYTKISPTSNSSYPESGLIAQDTYNNAPELRHLVTISDTALNNPENFNEEDKLIENVVDENGAPSYLSLNYIGIIPYLTGAVKEMKTLIDTQNSKINNLESENNQLKLIIDKLKNANSFIDFKNSL